MQGSEGSSGAELHPCNDPTPTSPFLRGHSTGIGACDAPVMAIWVILSQTVLAWMLREPSTACAPSALLIFSMLNPGG